MKPKITIACLLLCLVGWVVGFGCYPFVIWSPLNCSHEDIDIGTGLIRHQHFLLGICFSESTQESPISREAEFTTASPDWRRVNTYSPLVHHSPHYVFHSAINQMQKLSYIWEMAAFTPSARKRTSQTVLHLWQAGENCNAADDYIHALSNLAANRSSDSPPLSAEELPDA